MAHLPQLADPDRYARCEWDLRRDAAGRAYWTAQFLDKLPALRERIRESYPHTATPGRLDALLAEYEATLRRVLDAPQSFDVLDIHTLDELRIGTLVAHGFDDPYRVLKQQADAAALAALPGWLAELDALDPPARTQRLALGLMAGNIFDVGSAAAMARYADAGCEGQADGGFRASVGRVPQRPWWIDDLDEFGHVICRSGPASASPAYRHVAWFVDNAGPDICLGVLPMVRELLRGGSRVSLVANSRPALNDITAGELPALLEAVADDVLCRAVREGRLTVVASGSGSPLLDLAALDPACTRAIADADLVVLHGMGRALESNYRAEFTCDSLRTAVVKDPLVAERLGDGTRTGRGARLFDCMFRYVRGRA